MLDTFVAGLIRKKTFPGVSLLVAEGEDVLIERQFGSKATWPGDEPIAPHTIFDLASLTKPLVTAFLAAHFIEKGQWRLEDSVRRFFPGFPLPLTVEQLLTHSAGFRPWHPFYLYRPQGDLEQAAAFTDTAAAGQRVVYSDVGYILLRHLLEKVSGVVFLELVARVIIEPLRLRDTFMKVPPAAVERCAPTEVGNRHEMRMCRAEHARAAGRFSWRAGVIRGETHDANSFYAGGSAGNAGLFASARDLFRLGREFFPASATLLRGETVSLFWRNRTPWDAHGRTLGFQLNSSPGASGGSALLPTAIGHSGFTGTSLWLEAERERQWIVLSNRIHPRVRRADFNAVRRRLHQQLKLELGLS
jgi:CubicO group peptidase (beta-lactamase class C family)